jgi:hypothetical protein
VVASSSDRFTSRQNVHGIQGIGCEDPRTNLEVEAKTRIPEHAGN